MLRGVETDACRFERDRHHVATSTYGNHFRLTTVVGKMTASDQQTIAQPRPWAGRALRTRSCSCKLSGPPPAWDKTL